ncbi:multisubunit sodium/proton antiporter, MrpA subunit /multisubunit sodium/proton antiporter, MrpB subunit [Austwickia chelonae]|uniref:Na(+)/H(+) antiporter subunit A/B n=1 Tax=Austwickia chelonae NBRC 105200 TaxID=1184607 RepID=K6WAM7_9MICO|nr:Na+/H+ antiporter subunit A [Austwickia chelonae]GAB78897.1 Na(+)/H(+) antiporter subunit A/B [Austwickia chelonae NBRC 105200]SEV86100.1 multisubunit sodium/proton antiporter, MrpA subunit /multisubunit sodium/proton antiporter, MrpB subunit [Austwickia chelonae]
MITLLLAHLGLALLAPLLVSRIGARAFWILALPPAVTFGWAVLAQPGVHSSSPPSESYTWVPEIGLELAFRLDPLAWLMTLVVAGIGVLVLIYCAAYFDDEEPGLGRFAACLLAFAGAMLGLVTTDNLIVLYIFWEATTVLSYLLIGHVTHSRASRSAAMEALVVTTFGGLAMLIGIVLLGEQAGTYRLSEMAVPSAPATATSVAVVLLLVGAVTKSALLPFHFWLPGAMAAPTPVSAYLHAAAMVKAGIYLVARFAPSFADVPGWTPVVLVLGGGTMLLGAVQALRQDDLKLLLAYGTVSQLGFLVVLTGSGTVDAALAGTTMLLAHALFKASLFLTVGAIDHATGTRDLRKLSGLRRDVPVLAVAGTLSAASMAGLPPMFGFVGKEAAYTAYTTGAAPYSPWVLGVLVLGSALTLAYSLRFVRGAFRTDDQVPPLQVHAPGVVLQGVPLLLALASLALGPLSTHLEEPLLGYAATVGKSAGQAHLGLWHGVNLALVLSVATWALGFAVDAARHRLASLWGEHTPVPLSERAYRATMRLLDRVSLEVTGALQRGSLPLSLALMFLVFLVFPGGSLLVGGHDWASLPVRAYDMPAQVAVAAVTAAVAVAAVRSRRRLRAVILVGATGYGCAYLFLLHGAPDLALTQVLVETVSILVFILVLRRLSGRFNDDANTSERVLRGALGIGVGTVTALFALVMPGMRQAAPASEGMDSWSVDFGGGHNIVNVILVDARAWDTMGELSVVLAAATGVASLVFLQEDNVEGARRKLGEIRARRRTTHGTAGAQARWLAEGQALLPERRSVILEVVARLIFHVVIVWSIYLLLSGHDSPGGGFAAGLVAGLAIAVRYLAGGRDEMRAAAPVMPGLLLGTGLFLSAGNGLASMLAGGDVLQTWHAYVRIPLMGELHLVSSVVFDIGVYLVVIGLLLDILRSLGGALDQQIEDEPGRSLDDSPAHSDHGTTGPR